MFSKTQYKLFFELTNKAKTMARIGHSVERIECELKEEGVLSENACRSIALNAVKKHQERGAK